MQNNSEQRHGETAPENSCQTDKIDRRQAMTKLGKLAVYTTPVMTTLILSKEAEAQFGSPPGPPTNNPFAPIRPRSTPFSPVFPPDDTP